MAAYHRGSERILEDRLFDEAFCFDFYQAVRLIEMLHPEKISVGERSEADREAVRFRSKVSFEFPASAVEEIVRSPADGIPHDMLVNFIGLAANAGPLPAAYTELILERVQKKDTALRDFLDIFNHRIISLMYRVRKIFRMAFDFRSPEQTHFASYFFCLMGMGTEGLRQRMDVQDRALLFYTAILSRQIRSMSGLEAVLSDYFRVRVRGKQLCGRWYPLAQDQISKIGISGQNRLLGQDLVIGSRIWDQQGHFELEIGPLGLEKFLDFLPTGRAYRSLCQLTRFYAGTEFGFDFLLLLRKEEVPGTRLNTAGGSRLGWTSWLCTSEFKDACGRVKIKGQG